MHDEHIDATCSDTDPDTEATGSQLRLVDQGDSGDEVTADQIIEAILFSCDSPLSAQKIASATGGLTAKDVRQVIDSLNARYEQSNRAFMIEQLAGGYQMLTRPQFAVYLQQLRAVRSESRLSAAAMETLAVVAYKQPVLRAEVEAIRGVACGDMLRSLMDKSLVKIVGRAEELGRPLLYGTTRGFLEVFGLSNLEDLPKVPELQMPAESQPDDDRSAAQDNESPTQEPTDDPQDEQATSDS